MSDSILLNINTHSLNVEKTHDFNVRFDSLTLDHNSDYHIALLSYNVPYSWYSISAEQQNNVFRFSIDGGTSYTSVLIPSGNYGVQDLNLELQQLVVNNGGATDQFSFVADYNTIRVDLIFYNTNYQIDFSVPNTFREILGFNSQVYLGTTVLHRAENAANITNNIDSISINNSIVDSANILLNNRQSSSLYHITNYGSGPGSYLSSQVPYPIYMPINIAGNIHDINISIRNQDDQIVNLNNEHVTLSFHIKKMK